MLLSKARSLFSQCVRPFKDVAPRPAAQMRQTAAGAHCLTTVLDQSTKPCKRMNQVWHLGQQLKSDGLLLAHRA